MDHFCQTITDSKTLEVLLTNQEVDAQKQLDKDTTTMLLVFRAHYIVQLWDTL